jgi:hypothetical protein
VFSQYALSGESQDMLKLKNGTDSTVTITSVDNWALYFSNGKLISLKVIEKIITTNESIAPALQNLYPEVVVEQSGSSYTIHINALVLKPNLSSSHRVFNRLSFMAIYLTNPSEKLEVQLTGGIKGLEPLACQISGSTGLDFASEADYISRVTFGVGYQKVIDIHTVSLFINYGEAFASRLPMDQHNFSTLFVSLYYQISPFDIPIFLSLGGRYFFTHANINNNDSALNFNVGMGVAFNAMGE